MACAEPNELAPTTLADQSTTNLSREAAQPVTAQPATESCAAQEEEAASHYTNLPQTVFNMINCFVGAGILTVPFAFRLAGYSACTLLLLVAGLNWYTSLLLGQALNKAALLHPEVPHRSWSMGALAKAAFGQTGEHFVKIMFAVELWFALETFLVLTGISANLLTGLPETPVIIAAGILGCLSLSLPMKTISSSSFIAISGMVVGLIALIVCGLGRLLDHASYLVPSAEEHHVLQLSRTPASLGIFLYCFSGLPCLPTIRAAMKRPSEDYPRAIHLSFAFATLYYLAIGLLGYEFFANDTRRSFLKDLTPVPGEGHARIYGYISAGASGLFALKLQAGFPLYAGPILDAAGLGPDSRLPASHIWLGRAVFGFVSIVFAIGARNQIDAIAELMGAFLTNSTSILFPVAAYSALSKQRGEKIASRQAVVLSALLAFGTVYGVVGTVSAFRSFWYGSSIHVGQAVAGYVSATVVTTASPSHSL